MSPVLGRANILSHNLGGKDLFIYEDHRSILNVIYSAKQTGLIKTPVDLVYFDRHDDAKPPIAPISDLQKLRTNPPTVEDFWSFVEWKLSGMDDDWLLAGMEMGLIGDAILIGGEITINIPNGGLKYTDCHAVEHRVYSQSHIWDGLHPHGWLRDLARDYELKTIWDVMGWKPDSYIGRFDRTKNSRSLVVDFDLDCFTVDIYDQHMPWPRQKIVEFFSRGIGDHFTAKTFVHELIKQASLVTVARESDGCGSIQEANELFNSIYEELLLEYKN
jgi:hypothetical protein